MLAGFAGFTWRITVTGEGEHPHQVKPSLTDGVGDLQHLFGTDAAAVMATVDFDENIDRAAASASRAPVFEAPSAVPAPTAMRARSAS